MLTRLRRGRLHAALQRDGLAASTRNECVQAVKARSSGGRSARATCSATRLPDSKTIRRDRTAKRFGGQPLPPPAQTGEQKPPPSVQPDSPEAPKLLVI